MNWLQTFNAKVDLSQSQYYFVIQDTTTGYVGLPTAKDQVPLGILTNVPSGAAEIGPSLADSSYNTTLSWTTSYEQISPVICLAGVTELAVDGAYPIGQLYMARGDGTYNGIGTATDGTVVVARGLQASSTAGDVIAVLLSPII